MTSIYQNKLRGFTLIELTIAITISMLLIGGGLVSYQEFNRKQKVKTAGQNIKNILRDIQSKALNGEKPVSFACTQLNGYQVTFTDTALSYNAQCTNGDGPTETIYLDEDLTFSPPPSPFLFKVLASGVDIARSITISGFGRTYGLNVSTVGEVEDLGLGE